MSPEIIEKTTITSLKKKIEEVTVNDEHILLEYLTTLEEIITAVPDSNWRHEREHLLIIRTETEFLFAFPEKSPARLKVLELIKSEMLRLISKRI